MTGQCDIACVLAGLSSGKYMILRKLCKRVQGLDEQVTTSVMASYGVVAMMGNFETPMLCLLHHTDTYKT